VLPRGDHFGVSDLVLSKTKGTLKFVDLKDITKYGGFFKGMKFTIRGRLYNSRTKGKMAFIVIRDQLHTLQACGFVDSAETPNVTKEFVKFIAAIPKESVINVTGTLTPSKVNTCSITDWEFWIDEL